MLSLRYHSARKLDAGEVSEFASYNESSKSQDAVVPANETSTSKEGGPTEEYQEERTPAQHIKLFLNILAGLIGHQDDAIVPDLTALEECTVQSLEEITEPEYLLLLKQYGWMGIHFNPAPFKTAAFLQQLMKAGQNFYLKFYQEVQMFTPTNKRRSDASLTDFVIPFCPDILVDFIHENEGKEEAEASAKDEHRSQVRSFTFQGACVLADISGFSSFSGAMCLKGVNGLDELREATNGFLGHFVQLVYEFGGDGMYWFTILVLLLLVYSYVLIIVWLVFALLPSDYGVLL
jgi:hypothetical protein